MAPTAAAPDLERAWLTTSEIAKTLRVDERTVRNHADLLGVIEVGGQLRFPPDLAAPTFQSSARAARPSGTANRPVKGRIR
jgi:hypothetical protein